jgi:predicted DNA binding protein
MFEAAFELSLEGLPSELSARYGADIQLWCNDHTDFLVARADDPDGLVAELDREVGVRESLREGNRLVVVTEECLESYEETLLEPHLAANGCLSLPPLAYSEGRKRATVLALDPASLSNIYADLRAETTVEVRSKREIHAPHPGVPVVGPEDAFPSLTARQLDAFRIAHDRGYYDIPRGTTTAEIAAELGVERRTAEDHLRRAERKIADALADHLALLAR